MDYRPIGMFDSGVGGLTVFKEIKKSLPQEDIIYLGDTKRFPYGSKSKEAIIQISKQCTSFLEEKNVKLIVIACGTATSQAIQELKKVSKIPIIGIIEPSIKYLEKRDYKKIGIIATEGTIKSGKWEESIKVIKPDSKIISKATPLLAPMAEQGWTNNQVAKDTIKEYMKNFNNLDTLILGCTHYPLFSKLIKQELGEKTELINTGEKMATFLKEYLNINDMENSIENKGKHELYLTDIETNFSKVAEKLLAEKDLAKEIQKVEI